jgi:hypothetical protein
MRSPFDAFYASLTAGGMEQHGVYYGFYRAEVVEIPAGDDEGRVIVKCPRIARGPLPAARVLVLYSGGGGTKFAAGFGPKVGDSVIIAFEDGSPRMPWVVGGWAGAGEFGLPAELQATADGHTIRGFVLRDGSKLLFDEEGGRIRVETPSGASVVVGDGGVSITDGSATAVMRDGKTVFGGPVELSGASYRAVLGEALRSFMLTDARMVSPFGPVGPFVAVPESILSSDVKLK